MPSSPYKDEGNSVSSSPLYGLNLTLVDPLEFYPAGKLPQPRWHRWQELNPHPSVRSAMFYPLYYSGIYINTLAVPRTPFNYCPAVTLSSQKRQFVQVLTRSERSVAPKYIGTRAGIRTPESGLRRPLPYPLGYAGLNTRLSVFGVKYGIKLWHLNNLL